MTAGRYQPFGFDWLGRQFVHPTRDARGPILMLEPGTGDALEIPGSLWAFHTEAMAEDAEALVAQGFFRDWMAAGGRPLEHHEAVGYRVPLFPGGPDEIDNLEISDIDVYWSISAQLIAQTRGLAPGTAVKIERRA